MNTIARRILNLFLHGRWTACPHADADVWINADDRVQCHRCGVEAT